MDGSRVGRSGWLERKGLPRCRVGQTFFFCAETACALTGSMQDRYAGQYAVVQYTTAPWQSLEEEEPKTARHRTVSSAPLLTVQPIGELGVKKMLAAIFTCKDG